MNTPAGMDSFRDNYNNAATNIAIQIAEGSARNKNQFVYYLKMAKSSVRECLVFSSLAYKLRLFSNIQEEDSRNELMELTKMIGALIGSLVRSSNYEGEEEDMEPHPVHRNRYDA
jgi:four helix bundle protein